MDGELMHLVCLHIVLIADVGGVTKLLVNIRNCYLKGMIDD